MSKSSHKPYTLVGAGSLTATVWKHGDEQRGWSYCFNVARTCTNGRVSQRFQPRHLRDFARLLQVLTFTLADDGCLDDEVRFELSELAANLRKVLHRPDNNSIEEN